MKIWLAGRLSLFIVSSSYAGNRTKRLERKVMKKADFIPAFFSEWQHLGTINIDSVHLGDDQQMLTIYLNDIAMQVPARKEWITRLKEELKRELGRSFREYDISLRTKGRMLEEYIPNALRDDLIPKDSRRFSPAYAGLPLLKKPDQPVFINGLAGNHIALWPSHGLFFDQQLNRWQWQRARLWQTVEDIFPWSFTSTWLVPMLENAGAVVVIPRERDTQVKEVIVDHDVKWGDSDLLISAEHSWDSAGKPGFIWKDTLFTGMNPFTLGTSMTFDIPEGDTVTSITYIPEIPEKGDYAVYVSYGKTSGCISAVPCEVSYAGGKARFILNQCMGAGTWIYLGNFSFNAGANPLSGSVKIKSAGLKGVLSADAVRFGGGMGNVARKPGLVTESRQPSLNNSQPVVVDSLLKETDQYRYKISGKPRWMEGSRYYLQYAGMPDSLTYNLHADKNDYNDDYMSRPEWVNYLIGNARAQYSEKYNNGLGIPIDLVLAFHTDAGVTDNDSVIGTLGIYSTIRNGGFFPDGRSKLASRDLTDLVQTQIVEDIRNQVDPAWTRRGLWDREYSEAWRPIVPSMLLELLSHQNLADMRYGLDPRFKFIVARSVYKGILRYLAAGQGKTAVVQPLPPDHLAIEIIGDRKIKVSWLPVIDPVEPSAKSDGFMLYRKAGDDGFGPPVYTGDHFMIVDLPEWGIIYSFRVSAVNSGGESFPSETLSVGLLPGSAKPVLIINAFDRICAPAFFEQGDMAGIAWWEDEGVPYISDLSISGQQYDFSRNSEWISDDSQGWGASHADLETIPVAGNIFSFPYIHGKAILKAGFPFVSMSDEAFESSDHQPANYTAADIIFGEERGIISLKKPYETEFRVFTEGMIAALQKFASAGSNIFISGAYIGSDMVEQKDTSAIRFAADVLHYIWRTNHATTRGSVYATDEGRNTLPEQIQFNTAANAGIYRVESPDAVEPSGKGAFRICRYTSGNTCAGVSYIGSYRTVVLGFPFETIEGEKVREETMSKIMNFFTK
jgi:hypothetical protein